MGKRTFILLVPLIFISFSIPFSSITFSKVKMVPALSTAGCKLVISSEVCGLLNAPFDGFLL